MTILPAGLLAGQSGGILIYSEVHLRFLLRRCVTTSIKVKFVVKQPTCSRVFHSPDPRNCKFYTNYGNIIAPHGRIPCWFSWIFDGFWVMLLPCFRLVVLQVQKW